MNSFTGYMFSVVQIAPFTLSSKHLDLTQTMTHRSSTTF